MQRVRMKLNRIQQDHLLTSTTSMAGIILKQLIEPEYHDYLDNDHYREQMIYEHTMYAEQNDLIEKQIRADTLLSSWLQDEERKQFLKQNNQVECDVPPEYHIGRYHIKTERKDKQVQETGDKTFVRSIMTEQAPNYYNIQEIENPTLRVPLEYFRQRLIY